MDFLFTQKHNPVHDLSQDTTIYRVESAFFTASKEDSFVPMHGVVPVCDAEKRNFKIGCRCWDIYFSTAGIIVVPNREKSLNPAMLIPANLFLNAEYSRRQWYYNYYREKMYKIRSAYRQWLQSRQTELELN